MRANPGLSLDIDVSDRRVDLLQDGYDLVVRVGHSLPDSALRARKIGTHEMWVAGAPGFLEAHGRPDTVEALARLPDIRYGLRERQTWEVTRPDGRTATLDMRCAHRVTNGDIAARMAAEGLGVTVQPDFILADWVARGDLVRLLPDHAFPGLSAWAVWPEARYESARLRALVDALVEAPANSPASAPVGGAP